jgi:chitinase
VKKTLLFFVLLANIFIAECFGAARKKLVVYYANWTTAQRCPVTGNLTQAAPDLDAINYAFASIDTTTGKVVLSDPDVDVGASTCWCNGNFYKLMCLKAQNPQLKVLLSIGGWSDREKFKTIVDAGLTDIFVQSCVQILNWTVIDGVRYDYQHLFDGIDIDWEFDNGDPAGYAAAYLTLMTKLKAAFTAVYESTCVSYVLTTALQASPATYQGSTAINIRSVSALVNWINVMTYDFHGLWEDTTNFGAPLYGSSSNDQLCVDCAIRGFLRAGAPASKLLLGVSYENADSAYQGVPAGTTCGLRQPTTGSATGILGKYEAGQIYYKDIVTYLLASANCGFGCYGYCWSSSQCASWLYNQTAGYFVSYESPASACAKVNYLLSKNLAGLMAWNMCADTNGASLTHFIRSQLDVTS